MGDRSAGRSPMVVEVPRQQLGEAAGVLARAFAGDPLMRYLFGDQGDRYGSLVREFFRFSCEVHLRRGWRLLGIVPRTRIAGVAGVSVPGNSPWPEELSALYRELSARAGPAATKRMERYAALADQHLPQAPLCYVGVVGVRPESHRRGYGRALLERAHAIAAQDPLATGVGLDTENQANVTLYESLGYEVVARVRLDDLQVWCMFRPNARDRAPH
jgi:GNAT superfamily N-acetyltransferase